MQLIPNWQSAWRFLSVIAGLLLGFIDVAHAADWFGLSAKLGPQGLALMNAVVAAIVIPGLRIIQQSPPVSEDVKAKMVERVENIPTKENQS